MSGVLEWVRSRVQDRDGRDPGKQDLEEHDREDVPDHLAEEGPAEEGPAEEPAADVDLIAQTWTFGGTLAARVAVAVMWVLLLSGPAGLLVAVA